MQNRQWTKWMNDSGVKQIITQLKKEGWKDAQLTPILGGIFHQTNELSHFKKCLMKRVQDKEFKLNS